MLNLSVLILAAGKGERMRSDLPKVLHPLGGRPLLSYSIETAKSLKPKKLVVLAGHKAADVQRRFSDKSIRWAFQRKQLGTAHAVLCGLEALRSSEGPVLILSGDVPLIRPETLQEMKKIFLENQALIVLLTTEMRNPSGYGRIVRGEGGEVEKIVEERDADEREKKIREVNAGIYLVSPRDLLKPLRQVKKNVVKGEYYLTDLIGTLQREGKRILSLKVSDEEEVMGVNSQSDLAKADQILQRRIREKWMEKGVTLIEPGTIRIERDVEMEGGVLLHPGVMVTGRSRVRRGAEILPYSVIEESVVGEGARIGPFAHLRPGSVVGPGAHVGNFVELKKTRLEKGAKANHLAYLGDAVVGAGANVGAGTITCNYDGFKKHRTVIGPGAFIGSDTQLVAPVRVGKGAYVGSGTTVTKNVPSGALAVSRVEQKNILNWRRRKKG